MIRKVLLFVFVVTVLACGGGPTIVDDPKFKVTWPARTRANLNGVNSAVSARVTFLNAAPTGANVVVNIQRIPNPVAYTQIYRVGQRLNTIAPHATFEFFGGNGQTGPVVASGTADLVWYSTTMDMVNIALDRAVNSVRIIPPAPITTSTPPFDMLFVAEDADSNALALTPGSAKWSVVSGGANLQLSPSGRLTPVKAGVSVIKAEVDGVSSDLFTVTIN
ncbi:MAG TPA: hypothetical protein VK171_17045 [Fimbriimonas sp.]|nr:hypothetical protein [Fimbriimonas sp.]